MNDTAKCPKCGYYPGACACRAPASATPKGLDFGSALRTSGLYAEWWRFERPSEREAFTCHLQAQHAALLAEAVAEERKRHEGAYNDMQAFYDGMVKAQNKLRHLAPLVAAVREWREAFHLYRREVALPADETDDGATERFTAAHWWLRKAGKALAALPLPPETP